MEYAIVDIETTGGHASANGITEIAILIHDGKNVIDRFESLVNPFQPIPPYVQSLTGITDAMVKKAPSFKDIAARVYTLLKGRVFIAHNVNFDYSFVKYHLNNIGYEWQEQKLCTIRMARKIFPDQLSYSLGNLCRSLDIPFGNRHRAGGDAEATVLLWEKILASAGEKFLDELLRRGSGEQSVPIYLDTNEIHELPRIPGVYYFLNGKDEVVYVGKAIDLRKRVNSHFTNNKPSKQRQDFLREIHKVKFVPLPNELMAYLFEEAEIKRLWPRFNRSQKRPEQKLGLFSYEDGRGYRRLTIEKVLRGRKPLYSFGIYTEGRELIQKLIRENLICPRLSGLARAELLCVDNQACSCHESPEVYNLRVSDALQKLTTSLPNYVVMEPVPEEYPYARKWNPPTFNKKNGGLFEDDSTDAADKPLRKALGRTNLRSCILIENGAFYGMGYVPESVGTEVEILKQYIIRYPDNDYIRGIVNRYAAQFPERVLVF